MSRSNQTQYPKPVMTHEDSLNYLNQEGFLDEGPQEFQYESTAQSPSDSIVETRSQQESDDQSEDTPAGPTPKAMKEKGTRDDLSRAFEALRNVLTAFSSERPQNRIQLIWLAVETLTGVHQLLYQQPLSSHSPVITSSSQIATVSGIPCDFYAQSPGYSGSVEPHPQARLRGPFN